MYLTSKKLFSAKAAILTLAIATITPIFQIGFGTLTLPDSPLMFFWSASLYCAACEFFRPLCTQKHSELNNESHSSNSSNLYLPSYRLAILGILVGLACLSKYHGFVLGFGLMGFCLTNRRYRCVLHSSWAWLGLGLFLITISPTLLWNIQHDWVSFRFQSERAVPKSGYNLLSVVGVCLAGVAYMFPTIGFPLWSVSLRATLTRTIQLFSQKSLTYKENFKSKELLILWVSLPLILGFTLMGGYRQILPAWSMPGFWGITLLLGKQAVIWQQQSPRQVRRWLLGSGMAIASILLVVLLHLTTGNTAKAQPIRCYGRILTC